MKNRNTKCERQYMEVKGYRVYRDGSINYFLNHLQDVQDKIFDNSFEFMTRLDGDVHRK